MGDRKKWSGGWRIPLVVLGCLVLMAGCAELAGKSPAPESVYCPAQISWDLADSVLVTQFACAVKPFKGKEMLQYTIEIQNTGDQPARYRVQIINPEGKSVGGLLPRKGKPPVVKPGDKAKFTYPVAGYKEIPKKLHVYVMPLE